MGDTPDARGVMGGGGAANAVESMDTECDEDVYRMDCSKRGVFVIINNRYFQKTRVWVNVTALTLMRQICTNCSWDLGLM
ncbi:hypothetical protein LSAT2_002369 [Lamellibrachia satsuma]|nr:hypothetical protein LSAT2_002369 [Lamellibrachia satsuma]